MGGFAWERSTKGREGLSQPPAEHQKPAKEKGKGKGSKEGTYFSLTLAKGHIRAQKKREKMGGGCKKPVFRWAG